jgi:hypothetical protein
MERHGLRRGSLEEFANCDPDRRHLNQFGTDLPGADPTALVGNLKRFTHEASARRREGAAVAAHLILFASPVFFRPNDVADIGGEDAERVEKFRDLALGAVRERFGPIPAWRMDLDEATPAIDVFLVPLVRRGGKRGEEYWVSYREAFGGPKQKVRLLQTWFAEAMAPLGLVRGRPVEETGASRIPLHKQYRMLARDRATAESNRLESETVLRQAQEDAASARSDRNRAAVEAEEAGRVHAAATEALRGAEQRERDAEEARQATASTAAEVARSEAAARAALARAQAMQAEAAKSKEAADALLRGARSDQASAAAALRGAEKREREAEEDRQAAASAATAAAKREAAARTVLAQAQEHLKRAADGRREASAARAAAAADRGEAASVRREAEEAREAARADQGAAAAGVQEAQRLVEQARAAREAAAAELTSAERHQSAARRLSEELTEELLQVRQRALEEARSIIKPLVAFRDSLTREMGGILERRRGWPPEACAATAPVLQALVAIAGQRMDEVLAPFQPGGAGKPSADAAVELVDAAVSTRLTSLTPTLARTLNPALRALNNAALASHHRPPTPGAPPAQRGDATSTASSNTSTQGRSNKA